MACGKIPYPSRRDAKKALKLLNKEHKEGLKKLTDVYYCEECSNYHLTSMSKESSRNYKRHINKRA